MCLAGSEAFKGSSCSTVRANTLLLVSPHKNKFPRKVFRWINVFVFQGTIAGNPVKY